MNGLIFCGFHVGTQLFQSHGAYGLGILEDPALREVIVILQKISKTFAELISLRLKS